MFIPLKENTQVDKKYLSDIILEFLMVVKQNNATVVVSYMVFLAMIEKNHCTLCGGKRLTLLLIV